MLERLPVAVQVALALVGQLGLSGLLGLLLLRLAGLRSAWGREAWPTRLFSALLLGALVLPAAYAIVLLEGQTVASLVLVAVLALLVLARFIPTAPSSVQSPGVSRSSALALGVCGLAVLMYYPVQCVHEGPFPWQIIRADNGHYAQIARFLAEGFPENNLTHDNYLSIDRLPPTPYHYFEMWNSCWIARWSGLPHLAALQPVHAAQFLFICWVGLLALASKWGRLGSIQVISATLILFFKPDFILFILKQASSILSKPFPEPSTWLSKNVLESTFAEDLSFFGLYSELANIQIKTIHLNAVLIAALLLAMRRVSLGAAAVLILLPLLAINTVGLMPVPALILIYYTFSSNPHRRLAWFVLVGAAILGLALVGFYAKGFGGEGVGHLTLTGLPSLPMRHTLIEPHVSWVLLLTRLPLVLGLLWGLPLLLAWTLTPTQLRKHHWPWAAGLLGTGLVSWIATDPVLVADANQFFLPTLPLLTLLVALGLFAGLAAGRSVRLYGLLVWLLVGSVWQVRLAWVRHTTWYGPDPLFLQAAGRENVKSPVGGLIPSLEDVENRSIFERNFRLQGLNELYVFPQYLGNEPLVNFDSLPDAHTQAGHWLAANSFFTRWARTEQRLHGPLSLPEQQRRFVERFQIDWLLIAPGARTPAWVEGRVRQQFVDRKLGNKLLFLDQQTL